MLSIRYFLSLTILFALFATAFPAFAQDGQEEEELAGEIISVQACSDTDLIYVEVLFNYDTEFGLGYFVEGSLVAVTDVQPAEGGTIYNTAVVAAMEEGDEVVVGLSEDDNYSENLYETLDSITVTAAPCEFDTGDGSVDSVSACSDTDQIGLSVSVADDTPASIGVFVDGSMVDEFSVQGPVDYAVTVNAALADGAQVMVGVAKGANYGTGEYEFLGSLTTTAQVCNAAWGDTVRGFFLTWVGGPVRHNGNLMIGGLVVKSGSERGYWREGVYTTLGWCDTPYGCVAAEGGPLTDDQLDLLEEVVQW